MRTFVRFILVSGIGWLCDFLTFTLLVNWAESSNFMSNFISSYVGVTFVWFASLETVFRRNKERQGVFLVFYWGFQFASITAYSQLLHIIAGTLSTIDLIPFARQNPEIITKIIVTPFNLVTNFLFMTVLTRYMRHANV